MNPDPLMDGIRKLKGPVLPEFLLEKTWKRVEDGSRRTGSARAKLLLPCMGTAAAVLIVAVIALFNRQPKQKVSEAEKQLREMSGLYYLGLRNGEAILCFPGNGAREYRLRLSQKVDHLKVAELTADFIVFESEDGRRLPLYYVSSASLDLKNRD